MRWVVVAGFLAQTFAIPNVLVVPLWLAIKAKLLASIEVRSDG
jgi:hypothetical protein